jgi:hypothetical protein
LCCLALGVLPAPGQVAGIAVYTDFQQAPSPHVVSWFQDEVRSIVSPLGLEVAWKSLSGAHGVEIDRRLVVAKFLGTCESSGLPLPAFHDGSLGRTHISGHEVLPFMDIDCNRIRGFLRTPLMQTDPHERDEMLGRALGRVFAHELYHVLARTTHHSSGSVAHSTYSVVELTDRRLHTGECQILHLEDTSTPHPARASLRRGKAAFVAKLCSTCHGSTGQGTRRAPPLRSTREPVDTALLAIRLGVDGPAMCRRAEQMKITPPTLGARDIGDLVRYLNAPAF